jgi:hypothetical protein
VGRNTLVDKGITIISGTSLLCKSMSWKDIYVHFSFFSHALSLEKLMKKVTSVLTSFIVAGMINYLG